MTSGYRAPLRPRPPSSIRHSLAGSDDAGENPQMSIGSRAWREPHDLSHLATPAQAGTHPELSPLPDRQHRCKSERDAVPGHPFMLKRTACTRHRHDALRRRRGKGLVPAVWNTLRLRSSRQERIHSLARAIRSTHCRSILTDRIIAPNGSPQNGMSSSPPGSKAGTAEGRRFSVWRGPENPPLLPPPYSPPPPPSPRPSSMVRLELNPWSTTSVE